MCAAEDLVGDPPSGRMKCFLQKKEIMELMKTLKVGRKNLKKTCWLHDTAASPLLAILVLTLLGSFPPGRSFKFQLYSLNVWPCSAWCLTLFCLMLSLRQSSAPMGPALGNPAFRYMLSGFTKDAKVNRNSWRFWLFKSFNDHKICSSKRCVTSCLIRSAIVVVSLPFWPNSGQ